jgi:hypothetical protein
MEVNFLRLKDGRIALFPLPEEQRKDGLPRHDAVSGDEGQTWGPAKQLSPPASIRG